MIVEFKQVERPLALFVRGLLGHGVPLHCATGGETRAFANEHGWFFPARYAMYGDQLGRDVYYAAAAHLAAHQRFGGARMKRGSLRAIQYVLVSLFEDARVERALMHELPGLRALFARFHLAHESDHASFPSLCARIARASFDPTYVDAHPIVVKARSHATSPEHARELGSLLGNDIGQMRLSFNQREYAVEPPYRDDHRLLWEEQEDEEPKLLASERVEGSGQSQPGSQQLARPERQESSPEHQARSYAYPEYDYQIGTSRPAFCTLYEPPVETARVPPAVAPPVAGLAGRLQLSALARRRREHEGEALDLSAAVDAALALRAGHEPDPRVFVRVARQRQTLALTLLLDLSASTGDIVPALGRSVLALARDAALLLCEVLACVGDRFAVHGFSSNGRHHVEYLRFKELSQPWDTPARAALQALSPRQSTRMGPAIRHAARTLRAAREQRRVLLLLTDGAPSDVDVADARYLTLDAQHAVSEARRAGNEVFAISLDPRADRYMTTIFGAGRYLVLDRPERLPDILARLYVRLASVQR